MNEYLLINMLSEISPELLENNYMEKDLKKQAGSFWKRYFSMVKAKKKPRVFIKPFSIDNIEEKDPEHIETIKVECDFADEYTLLEEELPERNFSISIFKKKLNKLITIISGIAATLIFIIGILVFIMKRGRNIKLNSKKIQISF